MYNLNSGITFIKCKITKNSNNSQYIEIFYNFDQKNFNFILKTKKIGACIQTSFVYFVN